MFPKPEPRDKQKAREKRAEAVVISEVRKLVSDRDHYCRLYWFTQETRHAIEDLFGPCAGKSEWAHMGDHRRFKTRGKEPEERHTTNGSLMLCEAHHRGARGYDTNYFSIEPLTARGANGPLRFRCEDGTFEEPHD